MGLHLLDNASMALLHVLLENKTGYKETMKGINRFFPRKTTFFRKRETYYPSHTYGNVCEEPSGTPWRQTRLWQSCTLLKEAGVMARKCHLE